MEERIGPITESKAFEQLGILVLDGSGSMESPGESNQRKADEVDQAVRGLISRLKVSRRKENFYLAAITYDDKVGKPIRLEPTPVTQIDETADYNPLNGHGGETAIGDALEAAAEIADKFLEGQTKFPRSVVIFLMTDGQNNAGKNPVEVADGIKNSGKRITICAAGYGKSGDVDELTLKRIVSEPSGYYRTYDVEQLRKALEVSVTEVRG